MGARLRVEYSTDLLTWSGLGATTAVVVPVDVVGFWVSGWKRVATGAKADVFLRVVGDGGDGTVSPAFGLVSVQVRGSDVETAGDEPDGLEEEEPLDPEPVPEDEP